MPVYEERGECVKADIHPAYGVAVVSCSCGQTFTTRSTKPQLKIELCSKCHPFYTGKQKLVDSGGRVQRFQQRWGLTSSEGSEGDTVKAEA